ACRMVAWTGAGVIRELRGTRRIIGSAKKERPPPRGWTGVSGSRSRQAGRPASNRVGKCPKGRQLIDRGGVCPAWRRLRGYLTNSEGVRDVVDRKAADVGRGHHR